MASKNSWSLSLPNRSVSVFSGSAVCWCVGLPIGCWCIFGSKVSRFGDISKIYPPRNSWAVLSDEQMSNGYPFSLVNDEQMSNKVGVKHQPD